MILKKKQLTNIIKYLDKMIPEDRKYGVPKFSKVVDLRKVLEDKKKINFLFLNQKFSIKNINMDFILYEYFISKKILKIHRRNK